MASTVATFPGTGADDAGVGTIAWSDPGNVTAEDGATVNAVLATGEITHYLLATNFGFSIPSGSTINGIVVSWRKQGAFSVMDHRVRIIKGGVIGSTDKASISPWSSSLANTSYGTGTTDKWGETWTAADINAATFGAAIAATEPGSGNTAAIDRVTIVVHYNPPSGGGGSFSMTRSTSYGRSRRGR